MQTGRRLLELTRITQNKIVMQLMTLNRHFKERITVIYIKLSKQPVIAHADPVRINQCVSNYLNNALKFIPENGTVSITLEKEKSNAIISVRDSGIGIDPDLLGLLFKPFIQADHSLDRGGNGGLGLGLSIVKGIVELHGGKVAASSQGLGKGATFTITLPIAEESNDEPVHMIAGNTNKSIRILVIEDNKDLEDMLFSNFGILGHDAAAAYHRTEGIEAAHEMMPDIIFCDIGLPGMNGYEVARIIRQDGALSDVYLVAMTGYAGKDIEQARASGFDSHLAKPVNMDMMRRELTEYSKHKGN